MHDNYLEPLFTRERQIFNRQYGGVSPQEGDMRDRLIEYLLYVSDKFKLTRSTTSLAIHIFNYFQDAHSIAKIQAHIVCLTALHLAAKMHQTDPFVPKMKQLSKFIPAGSSFTVDLFLQIETLFLIFFDWSLLIPTVNDFIETYSGLAVDELDILQQSLTLTETHQNNNNTNWTSKHASEFEALRNDKHLCRLHLVRALRRLECTMQGLLLAVMKEIPSNEFSPSLIAAGLLMLSRLEHKFYRWSWSLEKMTRYAPEPIFNCINNYLLKSETVNAQLSIKLSSVDESCLEYPCSRF